MHSMSCFFLCCERTPAKWSNREHSVLNCYNCFLSAICFAMRKELQKA